MMSTILSRDEIVVKVFNNNIVLVNSEDIEKILFAVGIGFGKKPGSVIPKGTSINKVFIIEEKENINNLKELVKVIDSEFFAACEEAIYEVSNMVDEELNERIHISLIDHLFFAIKRLKNNEKIENPFLIETQTLYSKEYNLAKLVGKMIENHSNVEIPDGEIAFIALHIHSALNDGKISNTIKNTNLISEIVEYVEGKLDCQIYKDSLDYARFCTHVKFAIQRIMSNNTIDNDLTKIIKETYKESYIISEGIGRIIEKNIGISVTDDEISCLTIHVERFRMNQKK